MERKIDFEKVVQALQLCGPKYNADSCTGCPYQKQCTIDGGNTKLLEDAAVLLLEMREGMLTVLTETAQMLGSADAAYEEAAAIYNKYESKGFLDKRLNIPTEKGADE